jgi:V8-like Glu-specific endopeptidase
LVCDEDSSLVNPMSVRHLAGLILLPVAVWAQQPPKQVPASVPSTSSKSNAPVKTPSQILDENRNSIAVIVAAGNTSLKLGTGIFVRSTGLLLTNFHVVEGMDLVGVKVPGSNEVLWAKKATGFDPNNDLVLLEVETAKTKPISLGDSDHARVGEQIVVVGNPEGLEQTVSNGLLSGIRELDGRRLFQISAPISEGSSGSPVFNTSGEVIAVVVSSLETGQNLNFAVPINYAKPLLGGTTEEEISALPKRDRSDAQPANGNPPGPPPGDPAKLAVQAMSKIADQIRACEGVSRIFPTKEKKPHYSRVHWDPPTDVRFDVKPSDSLVAPFQGIVEFSISGGISLYLRTMDEASSAPDNPMFSSTTRHRYFYRINGSEVRLDYRTYFDEQSGNWVLLQGKADMCWDRIGNQ